eukprot:RCo015189
MTLVLKTVDSCEPRGGKMMSVLHASLHTSSYQQHQEREAMARFRSSKGKDMVLLFGDRVEVYKRSHSGLKVKQAIGHTTPIGHPYIPIGTPRTPTHIATQFSFPVIQSPVTRKQADSPTKRSEQPSLTAARKDTSHPHDGGASSSSAFPPSRTLSSPPRPARSGALSRTTGPSSGGGVVPPLRAGAPVAP